MGLSLIKIRCENDKSQVKQLYEGNSSKSTLNNLQRNSTNSEKSFSLINVIKCHRNPKKMLKKYLLFVCRIINFLIISDLN